MNTILDFTATFLKTYAKELYLTRFLNKIKMNKTNQESTHNYRPSISLRTLQKITQIVKLR